MAHPHHAQVYIYVYTLKSPPKAALTEDTLLNFATEMFAVGASEPMVLRLLSIISQATVELVYLVKQAITKLFEKQRKSICRSPERPDLQLSQDEALGSTGLLPERHAGHRDTHSRGPEDWRARRLLDGSGEEGHGEGQTAPEE